MSKGTYTREILIGSSLLLILVALMVLTFRSGDQDFDGFNKVEDCDDTMASVNPDAFEICDGIDNDCDGIVDPDNSVDAVVWFIDADGDGYGDVSAAISCHSPSGYVADSSDCDDSDTTINPGAVEIIDGIDNDCDGEIDELPAPSGYYMEIIDQIDINYDEEGDEPYTRSGYYEDDEAEDLAAPIYYYPDSDSDVYGF
jgi:hypothetical protein